MRLLPHGEAGSWLEGRGNQSASESNNFSIVSRKIEFKIRFMRNSLKVEQFLPGRDRTAVIRTGLGILKDSNLKLWSKVTATAGCELSN